MVRKIKSNPHLDRLENPHNLSQFDMFGGEMYKLVRGAFTKSGAKEGVERLRRIGKNAQIVPIKEFGKKSYILYKKI